MRKVFVLAAAAILVAGIAAADIGTVSVSTNVTTYTGTYDVDLDFSMNTAGAASPSTGDFFIAIGQVYYPWPWQTTAPSFTATTSTDWPMQRTDTTTNWSFSKVYSLTAPVEMAGNWGWWVLGGGWNYFSGATSGGFIVWDSSQTLNYYTELPAPQPTATPTPGGPTPTPNQSALTPVPTLSTLGMVLMGILLAGIGLLVLRRTN